MPTSSVIRAWTSSWTKTLDGCRENGYVEYDLGAPASGPGSSRRSRVEKDARQRNLPERIAVNTVIQGSAADLIKQAMIQFIGG